MVSIGKVNFEQAMLYYQSEVEQYYAGERDESFYGGKANKLLGESVAEHKGSFSKFLSKKRKVAAIDLTFSAPKSLSVLIELTDDPILREKLIEMHDNAMCKTMGYVENNYITARVFNGKDDHGRRKYVSVTPDKGIEWAAFRHHTSRENDPQLHTHVVVANRIYINGREYSIDARDLYEYHIAFGKMYRAELYNALQAAGISCKVTDYKNFFFTVEGISEEVIQIFSKQSKNMDKLLKELKKEFPDEPEARLKELANLESRPAKDRSKTLEELRARWKKESPQKYINYIKKFGVLATAEETTKAVAEAAEKLTENASAFSDLDFKNSVKQILIYKGYRFDEADIQSALKEAIKKHDIKEIGKNKFTTKEIRMAEYQIQNHARDTHNKFEGILSKEEAVKAIEAWENKKRLEDSKFKLTNDQRKTLEMMLTTKDGVMIFQGDAGTGKTTVLRALNDIATPLGFKFIGLSTTGQAAKEITEASGFKAMTLDKFLKIMRGKKNIEENNKKIYIVDESSMNATIKLREVSLYAKLEGAKMFMGGDKKQMPSIQAGGMFERMQKSEYISSVELKESIRQKDPVLKGIVKHFAEGKAGKGLKALAAAGKVHEIKDKDELFQSITDAYVAEGDKNNFILAAKNKDRFVLNQLAREKLKQKDLLDTEDFKIKIKEGKNLNDYDKKQIWSYDEKDLIVRGKNKSHEYEVKNVDIENRMLTVYDRNNDKEISMQASKEQRVYYEVEKNFSKGDKIVFLENDYDAHLDVRNGQTAIIDKIKYLDGGNYQIDATTMSDEPKKVSFETKDYDYFTHAYCITTYKSQGQTANKGWIYAVDTSLNEMYVNLSRFRYHAEVFTTNLKKLFGTSKKVENQVDSLTQEGRERFKEEQVKKIKESGTVEPEKEHKKEKSPEKDLGAGGGVKPGKKRGDLDIS